MDIVSNIGTDAQEDFVRYLSTNPLLFPFMTQSHWNKLIYEQNRVNDLFGPWLKNLIEPYPANGITITISSDKSNLHQMSIFADLSFSEDEIIDNVDNLEEKDAWLDITIFPYGMIISRPNMFDRYGIVSTDNLYLPINIMKTGRKFIRKICQPMLQPEGRFIHWIDQMKLMAHTNFVRNPPSLYRLTTLCLKSLFTPSKCLPYTRRYGEKDPAGVLSSLSMDPFMSIFSKADLDIIVPRLYKEVCSHYSTGSDYFYLQYDYMIRVMEYLCEDIPNAVVNWGSCVVRILEKYINISSWLKYEEDEEDGKDGKDGKGTGLYVQIIVENNIIYTSLVVDQLTLIDTRAQLKKIIHGL